MLFLMTMMRVIYYLIRKVMMMTLAFFLMMKVIVFYLKWRILFEKTCTFQGGILWFLE